MGGTLSQDPRLGRMYSIDEINASEKVRLARVLGTNTMGSFIVGDHLLPVLDLPYFVDETNVADGNYVFSLRGRDEALFRAYYNKFLDTWGMYVYLRDDVVRLANGEWCVTLVTLPTTAALWTGRMPPPPPMEHLHDDLEIDNARI
jgi:hypothetical protein